MSISANFKLGVLRNVAKGLFQDISALKLERSPICSIFKESHGTFSIGLDQLTTDGLSISFSLVSTHTGI